VPAVGEEVAAGAAPEASRQQPDAVPLQVHREDLVAHVRGTCGLEDQLLPVEGKVRLGVLQTVGELAKVGEMTLTWV
jgi:hypothetical protein